MSQVEEYVKSVLKVLVYIEGHLEEEMTLDELAKLGFYSPYHFHRIFQTIVGETIHQYVKRLKLEKAAGRLRYTKAPVTEIALDADYETPSSFTRAFKQFMGRSPKNYRSIFEMVNVMEKTIKELPMIDLDSIEKNAPDLSLLFVRKCGSYEESPQKAWESMLSFIHENHLNKAKLRYFGISYDNPEITSKEQLRYDAAILTNEKVQEKGEVGRLTLKGGKYATFTHKGPYEGLTKTFDQIFFKWLPDSKQKFDENRACFCEYLHMEYLKTAPEKLVTKIYIPLQ